MLIGKNLSLARIVYFVRTNGLCVLVRDASDTIADEFAKWFQDWMRQPISYVIVFAFPGKKTGFRQVGGLFEMLAWIWPDRCSKN